MAANPIRQFFSDPENANCICTRLHDSDYDLQALETQSVSDFSPRPVSDDETLARQIFSPHMLDPDTREPTTLAFTDAEHRGLSTDRLGVAGT